MKVSQSGGPFSTNDSHKKPKSHDYKPNQQSKSNDRITRYATPNRYDAMHTPASFLDRRPGRSRSTSRANKDRITYRARPEIGNSDEGDDVHASNTTNHISRQPVRIQTSNSNQNNGNGSNLTPQNHNQTHRGPIDSDLFKSRHTPVSLYFESRLNEIKVQRQRERQQENMNAYLQSNTTNQSSNNHVSLSVYSSMGSVDEEGNANNTFNKPKMDSLSPYNRQYSHQRNCDVNQRDASLSESEVSAFFRNPTATPEQNKAPFFSDQSASTSNQSKILPRQESQTVQSKCRLFIKSDSKPVAKTLVCPSNATSSQDSHLDKHLDHLASKMGLLSASSCDDEGLNYDSVAEIIAKSGPVQDQQEKQDGHLAPSQTNRKNRIGSFLRRLSPRLMRRSKSFSPARPPQFGNDSPASSRVPPNDQQSTKPDEMDLSASNVSHTDKPKSGAQSVLSKLFKSRTSIRSRTSSSGKYSIATSSSPGPQWSASQASPGIESLAMNSTTHSQKTDNGSRKDSSISGSSWNSNIAPDNRRLLDALERDRISNPYTKFKQNRHHNQQSELESHPLPGSTSNDAMNGGKDRLTDTGPLRPSYFTFDNMNSIQKDFNAVVNSPRYVNLSVSAFGYGGYYKQAGLGLSSPGKCDPNSAVIAKPPLPNLSTTSPSRLQDESLEQVMADHPTVEENNNHSLETGQSSPEQDWNLPPQCNNNHHSSALDLDKTPTKIHSGARVNHQEMLSSSMNQPRRIHNHQSVDVAMDSQASIIKRKKTRSTGEDKDARQRSSLIMLAVAHSSPRCKTQKTISPSSSPSYVTVKPIVHSPHSEADRNVASYQNGDYPTPGSTPCGTTDPLGVSTLDSSGVGSCEVSPNTPSPALSNGVANHSELQNLPSTELKDGNYFLNLADSNESIIRTKIKIAETDLQAHIEELSEEVSGQIRTAIGKANLLITEKFAQFRGLCHQNLQSCESNSNDNSEDFPTLSSDLDGFWAMVMLQIDDIHNMFHQIELLKLNNWQPQESCTPSFNSKSNPVKRPTRTKKQTNSVRKEDPVKVEARRRLIAAKREALLKKKQEASNQDNDIMIYS